MADQNTPLDGLVMAYRRLRDTINERESQHKEEIAELREQLNDVGAQLLEVCNDTGADSIKTSVGTVSRRIQSRYWTTDWQSMYNFILENDAPFLLEQRIHNGNLKEFLDENPDKLPIGLQIDSKYVVHVRKPTAK
jgi:hypothetical protein